MPVVFNQAHFSEFVHEERNSRPCCAYHLGESLVTQHGYRGVGSDRVFPQTRELQKHPGQPLLAMIEQLIAEILLEVYIALQQRGDECFRKLDPGMESTQHSLHLDSQRRYRFECRS